MMLTLKAADLRDAMAATVTGRYVFAHVLLTTEHDRLTLTSGNGVVQLSQVLLLDAPCDFTAALSADKLKHALNGLGGDVTLALDSASATLKQGRRRYQIDAIAAADYPALQTGTHTRKVPCDVAGLAAAVARVKYAASSKDVRDYLLGLWIQPDYIAAADGYRLAARPNTYCTIESNMIVPLVALPYLAKVAGECTEMALVSHKKQGRPAALCFTGERVTLLTRLIDSTVPDWLPGIAPATKGTTLLRVSAAALKDAATRLKFFNAAAFLAVDGNSLRLDSDDGRYSETLDADTQDGADMSGACINLSLLADAAAAMGDGDCVWRQRSLSEANVFSATDDGEIHVVMPIK